MTTTQLTPTAAASTAPRRPGPPGLPGLPTVPALVAGHVTHHRGGSVRHRFRHSVYQWLVDLDALPEQPWYLRAFASFSAADHLGDPGLSIRANVERYLSLNGIRLGPSSRILMLANARVMGHVFDPLSVFWCFDANTTLIAIVAEVVGRAEAREGPQVPGLAGQRVEVDEPLVHALAERVADRSETVVGDVSAHQRRQRGQHRLQS